MTILGPLSSSLYLMETCKFRNSILDYKFKSYSWITFHNKDSMLTSFYHILHSIINIIINNKPYFTQKVKTLPYSNACMILPLVHTFDQLFWPKKLTKCTKLIWIWINLNSLSYKPWFCWIFKVQPKGNNGWTILFRICKNWTLILKKNQNNF